MYKASQKPCILVDAGVTRFKIRDQTRELIEKTGMVRVNSLHALKGVLMGLVDLLLLADGKDCYQRGPSAIWRYLCRRDHHSWCEGGFRKCRLHPVSRKLEDRLQHSSKSALLICEKCADGHTELLLPHGRRKYRRAAQ